MADEFVEIRQTTRPHFRVGIRRKPSTFSLSSTTPRISSTSATTSTPSPFTFSRPTKIIPPRRKYFTQTTTSRILESQETSTKPQLELRKKILLRRTTLAPPTTQKAIPDNTFDQSLQPTHMVSSVEDSNESVEETSSEEAKKTTVIILPLTISEMFSSSNSNNVNAMTQAYTVSHAKISTRAPQPTAIKHIVSTTPKFHRIAVKSTTPTYAEVTPLALYTTEKISKNPKPFQKTRPSSYFSQDKYEYYDDLESSILSMLPAQSKVLIHPNGDIECLDQGNFPHPAFCRKFISCARMEKGRIYGWEYTCPKGLSFDPIGGMCNWSADLGCNE